VDGECQKDSEEGMSRPQRTCGPGFYSESGGKLWICLKSANTDVGSPKQIHDQTCILRKCVQGMHENWTRAGSAGQTGGQRNHSESTWRTWTASK
jgi:hypothetical protein